MPPADDITPRHVLEGQALMDYLVERAADRAKTALLERDERRKRIVTFIFSVLALVGVGSVVSALKLFVRSEADVLDAKLKETTIALEKRFDKMGVAMQGVLESQIKQAIVDEMKGQIGAVSKTLEENDQFEHYAELAVELPEKLAGIQSREDKYVAEKMDEVLNAAERLAALKHVTRRTRFLMATRQIVGVMSRFNLESAINQMDDLLGDVMATDQELARTLVDHYGQLVIGSPQPIDAQPDNMRRLQRYIKAAKERNYPEKALIWSVFLEFKRHGFTGNSTTRSLLESTLDLSDNDRAEFWFNLYVYTDPNNWMLVPDQQGRELAQLMAALQRAYPEITPVMEQNIAGSKYMQRRLANTRAGNPVWQQREDSPASEREPSSRPRSDARSSSDVSRDATAQRPGEDNPLR